jgi:hypothetical protein
VGNEAALHTCCWVGMIRRVMLAQNLLELGWNTQEAGVDEWHRCSYACQGCVLGYCRALFLAVLLYRGPIKFAYMSYYLALGAQYTAPCTRR